MSPNMYFALVRSNSVSKNFIGKLYSFDKLRDYILRTNIKCREKKIRLHGIYSIFKSWFRCNWTQFVEKFVGAQDKIYNLHSSYRKKYEIQAHFNLSDSYQLMIKFKIVMSYIDNLETTLGLTWMCNFIFRIDFHWIVLEIINRNASIWIAKALGGSALLSLRLITLYFYKKCYTFNKKTFASIV